MASATPKLDRIIDQFTSLMGYPATYTGDNLDASDVLTVKQVESYISKAMFKLFNQYWTTAVQQGPKSIKDSAQRFLSALPEMVKVATLAFSSGSYTIVNPNFDLLYPYGAKELSGDEVYARILDASLYSIVQSRIYPQYTATAAKPIIFYMSNLLFLFPVDTKNFSVAFIKKPVRPTDGDILRQNQAGDSPFSEHWEPIIADLADKIYRQERQLGD